MPKAYIDVGTRIQALALLEIGIQPDRIMHITGMSRSSLYRMKRVALERGYDAAQSRRLKLAYVVDGFRPGRPGKAGRKAALGVAASAGLGEREGEVVVYATGVVVDGGVVVRSESGRVGSEEMEMEMEGEGEMELELELERGMEGRMEMGMERERERQMEGGMEMETGSTDGDGASVGTVETRDRAECEDDVLSLIQHELSLVGQERVHDVA